MSAVQSRTVTGTLGAGAPDGWVSFILASAETIDLTLADLSGNAATRLTLLDATGNVLGSDSGSAFNDASLIESLSGGTYFVHVASMTDPASLVRLTVAAPAAVTGPVNVAQNDGAIGDARSIGTLGSTQALLGWIGSNNTADDYKFTLASASAVDLSLVGLSAGVTLTLDDQTGTLITTTVGSNAHDASLLRNLAAGTYIVSVALPSGDAATSYELLATAAPLATASSVALNAVSATPQTMNGWVGTAATDATYTFSLTTTETVVAHIGNLAAGVSLTLDDSFGGNIATTTGGPDGDAILIEQLDPGTYKLDVGGPGQADTSFVLSLSGTPVPAANGPVTTATSLGTIGSAGVTVVGSDTPASPNALYSFNITDPSRIALLVSGLSSATTVFLEDSTGAVVSTASAAAGSDLSLNTGLAAGSYQIQVRATAGTVFTLNAAATPFTTIGGATQATATMIPALDAAPVTESAADFVSALASLESEAASGTLGPITLSDGASPTISITSAQLTSDGDVLRFITNPATFIVTDGGYRALSAATTAANIGVGGVKTIVFNDGTVTFDATSRAAQVARLYQAALGRAPDPQGFAAWTDSTQSLTDLANGFLSSAEFASRFGTSLSDSAFVTALYGNVLNRAPDAAGFAAWTGALASGSSRASVLIGFAQSNENIADTSSLVASGLFVIDPAAPVVARLYDTALGRLPDAAGLRAWDTQLDGGAMSEHDVATAFTGSAEFATTYGALDNQAFVTALYNNTLHRAPDATGLADWVGALNSGAEDRASVMLGFSESAEHIANTMPDIISTSASQQGVLLAG